MNQITLKSIIIIIIIIYLFFIYYKPALVWFGHGNGWTSLSLVNRVVIGGWFGHE